MGIPQSPGSYISERDLSQRVRAISTSIGAIVGASKQGPIMETTLVTNEEELISIFGKPDPKVSLMHYSALEFLKESKRLYVTRVVNDDTARGPVPLTGGAIYTVDDSNAQNPRPSLNVFDDGNSRAKGLWDPYSTYQFNPNQPGVQNMLFMVCASNPGDWNNRLYIQIRPNYKSGLTSFDEGFDDPYAFWVDVFLDYKNPRQVPNESYLVKREMFLDGYGNQMFIEDVINKKSRLIRVRNNEYAPQVKVSELAKCYIGGGTNGGRISFGQVCRGWDLYKDPEHIDVNLFIQGGAPLGMHNLQDVADIQRHMVRICEDRMDAIALLDIPSSEQETANASAYVRQQLNIDSSYGAIYTSDVKIKDTFNDIDQWIPMSGIVAANCAMTDENYNVWFAPAGMYRGRLDVLESRYIYNQGHRDALDDARINMVRFFPKGQGYRVWNETTLQSMASALSNISVRRLMNYIEKSIGLANMYSVFDPNDQVLRSRITSMIERFLKPIYDAGGLYWFKVICDETNNTPATIAEEVLIVDAYFDPVISTKRIHLNANILRTGSNYKEFVLER